MQDKRSPTMAYRFAREGRMVSGRIAYNRNGMGIWKHDLQWRVRKFAYDYYMGSEAARSLRKVLDPPSEVPRVGEDKRQRMRREAGNLLANQAWKEIADQRPEHYGLHNRYELIKRRIRAGREGGTGLELIDKKKAEGPGKNDVLTAVITDPRPPATAFIPNVHPGVRQTNPWCSESQNLTGWIKPDTHPEMLRRTKLTNARPRVTAMAEIGISGTDDRIPIVPTYRS